MLGVKLLILMRHWAKEELKMFCLLQCLEAGHSAVQSKHWAKTKYKKKGKRKNPCALKPKKTALQAAFKFLGSVKS